MELEARLDEEWRTRRASMTDAAMRFADAGLVLGAGTMLAPAGLSSRDISIDIAEPRFLALLSAAHRRLPTVGELTHLRKAAERWREREDGLTAMHLALSGLSRLMRPNADAHRLFLADSLLQAGVDTEALMRALDLKMSPDERVSKYSPDQPRVPAGSGPTSGEWTTAATSSDATSHANPLGAPQERTSDGHAPKQFTVELPSAIIGAALPPPTGPFGHAVRALGDELEVADSISKWRELGPKGEALIEAAVEAKGWTLLGRQVYVRTPLGLRVEDVMVHVPAGTAGNVTAYDGFIEVKVNGGRYSPLQQAKDAIIGDNGGILLTPIRGYRFGTKIVLETGLANVTITYEPE